jgi:hypothetical protein
MTAGLAWAPARAGSFPCGTQANGGTGLLLVDALSDRCGMDTCERGTCVWFELAQ